MAGDERKGRLVAGMLAVNMMAKIREYVAQEGPSAVQAVPVFQFFSTDPARFSTWN